VVRRIIAVVAASAVGVGVAAYLATRGSSSEPFESGVILYSIGLTTDPYGHSNPGGFGIVEGVRTAAADRVEVRAPGLGSFGGADWIDEQRIAVVPRAPPFRTPLIYRWADGRLAHAGRSPAPPRDTSQEWSPDATLVASEPIARCDRAQALERCYRQSGRVYLQRPDGTDRRLVARGAHLRGWTPDGRLLLVGDRAPWRYRAFEPQTGRSTIPLSARAAGRRIGVGGLTLGVPKWSADGRYMAAFLAARWPKSTGTFGALAVAFADGRVIRAVTSRHSISMFAWAPVGHRLAYTTSGSPDPHELWVVHGPTMSPRRIFTTAARHFDWITWSPDGRRLLVDDPLARRWLLVDPDELDRPRAVPRPGGRPLWCCPVNAYTTLNG
jgi:hypothetical protein